MNTPTPTAAEGTAALVQGIKIQNAAVWVAGLPPADLATFGEELQRQNPRALEVLTWSKAEAAGSDFSPFPGGTIRLDVARYDNGDGWATLTLPNGTERPLNLKLSLQVQNSSPDGFNWGYTGSGPFQLALAVLMELLPYHEAARYAGAFRDRVCAALPKVPHVVASVDLATYLVDVLEQNQ